MGRLKLRKYFFSQEGLLLLIAITLFVMASTLNQKTVKPTLELSKQDTALNVNVSLLNFTNAGNKRLLTDLLWVQTLIESDVEHYDKRDLNNWMFLRFNTISILDPKFYENYLFGGQFLAIVKDDLEGANLIYEKGLQYYPEDYYLNYNAGFLNYYEIGNYKKGLHYLSKVVNDKKAPTYLISIINKLKLETGFQLEEIYSLVLYNFQNTQDETLRKRLSADLYALKAEIDLKCLNNEGKNCSYIDFDGKPYIRKENQFYSAKLFLRYRINKREANPLPPEEKRTNYIK